MKEKELLKKSGYLATVILIGISIFWFLFSIQTSFGYSGTGTTQDLKSGSRFNGDLLAQPLNGSVTIYYGTQSTQGTGTLGYIGTNTAGLPKLKYSYTGGSSTFDFIGFGAVKIDGVNIPSESSVSGKINITGGTGTENILTNTTLAGQGTITATFRSNGLDITPAEYSTVNNATGELQSQINNKQPTLVDNSPGTITNTLGYTPVANTAGSITTALGYTPVANTQGSITTSLGYTPVANTAGSITTALGYTPTNLGSTIELGTETTGNTDNISEGSTNKYHTDSRVNAAVGSLSVNQHNDVNIIFNENDFVKIVGGQLVAGSSTVTIAFPEVTGSATASQLPPLSSLNGLLSLGTQTAGSVTASQLPLIIEFPGTTTAITGTSAKGRLINVTTTATITGTNSTALMTGYSAPSPNIVRESGSESPDFFAWKAFDRVFGANNRWTTATTTAWISYDFGTNNAHAIVQYGLNSAEYTYFPKDWFAEGSSDNINWVTLDTRTNQSMSGYNNDYKNYTITSPVTYQFFRLRITDSNHATYLDIAELQLLSQSNYAQNNLKYIPPGTTTAILSFEDKGTSTTGKSYAILNVDTLIVGAGTTTSVTGTTTAFSGWYEGAIRATAFNVASTEKIKENIQPLKITPDWLDATDIAKKSYISEYKPDWIENNKVNYVRVINASGTGTITLMDDKKMEDDYKASVELEWASDLNQNLLVENVQKQYEKEFWSTFDSIQPRSWTPIELPERRRRGLIAEEIPDVIKGEDMQSVDLMALHAYSINVLQSLKNSIVSIFKTQSMFLKAIQSGTYTTEEIETSLTSINDKLEVLESVRTP